MKSVRAYFANSKKNLGAMPAYIFVLIFSLLMFANHAETNIKEPIKVVTEYYPPYSFKNVQGKLEGCSVSLVTELFQISNDALNIQVMPWSRAYMTAVNNKNTLIFSISRNQIREKMFYWIGKIKREKYFFWGLKSRYKADKISAKEFYSSVIVAAKFTTNDQMLTKKGKNILYRVTELTQGINMVLNRRVDLIVETKVGLQKRFEHEGFDFSLIKPVYELPELNYDLYIAMNINSDQNIVKRMKTAYQQLVDNGKFAQIIGQCGN